ncbi:hypothetical protein DPMN_026764 [Dreissena polymorpha]|uniref:Uncharacterized protein n=1 Tax=Dreissena polymorpha TaxID=45954 RepID=A0A9D4LRW0_DREPO|nr:hypothetical protein DPMN_026749 [Dreissena polymorpha]KAH3863764.1 hypothetical protein DPMN_026764 [Dreissena polymorpha]
MGLMPESVAPDQPAQSPVCPGATMSTIKSRKVSRSYQRTGLFLARIRNCTD